MKLFMVYSNFIHFLMSWQAGFMNKAKTSISFIYCMKLAAA